MRPRQQQNPLADAVGRGLFATAPAQFFCLKLLIYMCSSHMSSGCEGTNPGDHLSAAIKESCSLGQSTLKVTTVLLPTSPIRTLCGVWSGGRGAPWCVCFEYSPSTIPVHIDHKGHQEAPAVGSLEMPGRARYAAFLL